MATEHETGDRLVVGIATMEDIMKPPIRSGITVAAVALVAAGVTACGSAQVPVKASAEQGAGSSSTSAPAAANSEPAPAASSTTAPSSTTTSPPSGDSSTPVSSVGSGVGESESKTVDGHEIGGLPKGFPFPGDAKVTLVVAGSMVELSAPTAKEIAAFYRTELPKAGLPVDFDSGGDSPVLLFENDHWQGQVSVNSESGALITWGPPLESSPDPSTTSSAGTAAPSDDPLSGSDLGLTGADFFLQFPPGTELANIVDSETSGSFSFANPDPATVLAFYREFVKGNVHVTRDSDQEVDGVTTMKWHTDEANVVLVVGPDLAQMTLTPR